MGVETPAEACAALAVLIAGADEIGTMEESRFMFETVAAMPVFEGLGRAQFSKLMEETTDWVWSTFPVEGGRVTDAGVGDLLGLICKALPKEMRGDALKAAVGLAMADGMAEGEQNLLGRLCDGLEVDRGLVPGLADRSG
jgi:tellurite resistance protein